MIFVDASALVAILNAEPEADGFIAVLDTGTPKLTSEIAVFEAAAAIARERQVSPQEAEVAVRALLVEADIEMLAITTDIGGMAIEAFQKYGKGRHPSRLNMGDCFAYACAKSKGASLLYKGEDFPLTDMVAATA